MGMYTLTPSALAIVLALAVALVVTVFSDPTKRNVTSTGAVDSFTVHCGVERPLYFVFAVVLACT
jgi:hypothetical protein